MATSWVVTNTNTGSLRAIRRVGVRRKARAAWIAVAREREPRVLHLACQLFSCRTVACKEAHPSEVVGAKDEPEIQGMARSQ